jgi:hypothetical protein
MLCSVFLSFNCNWYSVIFHEQVIPEISQLTSVVRCRLMERMLIYHICVVLWLIADNIQEFLLASFIYNNLSNKQ